MSSTAAANTARQNEEEDIDVPMPNEPYHDDVDEEEQEQPAYSDEEEEQVQELSTSRHTHRPARERTHTQISYEPSVISIQSNPPPYELYPPAKNVFGRFWNWLRNIPRWNTHQAIYLPTIHNSSSSRRSIFSLRRHRSSAGSSLISSNNNDDDDDDDNESVSCWSYYFAIVDRLPERPRIILPDFLAKYRWVLILISVSSLFLFSFLLFCAIYFSPIDYPAPIFPDKTTDTSARFLTLNIFMRPPLIKNNWSDYKDDRLAYIEKYILPDYDIIAFEESFAFASRRKDHLIKSAIEQGYNYHLESPRKYPWNIGVDGGLLIISRFPIRQSHIIEYPRGQHSDWLSIKGALHAEIELNATRKLHLYSTHTQASYDLNNVINQDDTYVRLSQFALLHDFIYDTAGESKDPIMVVGDLNVDAAVHPKNIPITTRPKESSEEYLKMVAVIKGKGIPKSVDSDERWFDHPWKLDDLRDVVYDHFGYHPVTFGDYTTNEEGDLVPAEIVLTNWDQLMTVQSIDRIFFSNRESNTIQLKAPTVEKFWVKENTLMDEEERQETEFTQISDHYGLSCEIRLI